jgi:hypothetical protein
MLTKSSSLFFVFARDYYDQWEYWDDKVKMIDVKWIDCGHMEFMEEGQRDEGLIKGLLETVKLLKEIKEE